jgi:hypothetical protein
MAGRTSDTEGGSMQRDESGRGGATYQGVGRTLDEAFEDVANNAVADSVGNVGKEFDVVRWVVTVDNPRISQHKVVINER